MNKKARYIRTTIKPCITIAGEILIIVLNCRSFETKWNTVWSFIQAGPYFILFKKASKYNQSSLDSTLSLESEIYFIYSAAQ